MTTATTTEPKTRKPFLQVLLDHAGNPPLPDGYDTWGYKITRPDLRTYRLPDGTRYRWPFPGATVTDPGTVVNGNACPTAATGGFCVALTLRGAGSGGYGHATILLLAYRISDAKLFHTSVSGTMAYTLPSWMLMIVAPRSAPTLSSASSPSSLSEVQM